MSEKPLKDYFLFPFLKENQVLVAVLGICSALGITNSLSVALTMGLSVMIVTGFSSFFVSLVRKQTPDSVRMIAQLAIISLLVIIVDQFLRAYLFNVSKSLSVYVGLIITNCIVMGRAEAMAKNIPPVPALLDGLGAGAGYAVVLLIVGFFRELLGFGTLFGISVVPDWFYANNLNPNGYMNCNLMVLPPAAFFLIGTLIFIFKKAQARKA